MIEKRIRNDDVWVLNFNGMEFCKFKTFNTFTVNKNIK